MTTVTRPPAITPPLTVKDHLRRLNAAYEAHRRYWRAGDLHNAWYEERTRNQELHWFQTQNILLGYNDKHFVIWREKGRDGRPL